MLSEIDDIYRLIILHQVLHPDLMIPILILSILIPSTETTFNPQEMFLDITPVLRFVKRLEKLRNFFIFVSCFVRVFVLEFQFHKDVNQLIYVVIMGNFIPEILLIHLNTSLVEDKVAFFNVLENVLLAVLHFWDWKISGSVQVFGESFNFQRLGVLG